MRLDADFPLKFQRAFQKTLGRPVSPLAHRLLTGQGGVMLFAGRIAGHLPQISEDFGSRLR